MSLKPRKRSNLKRVGRIFRKARVRKLITGSGERPRLSVFRSNRHIYAQIIDDEKGVTLAAASSAEKDFAAPKASDKMTLQRLKAQKVGEMVAERALTNSVKRVKFDRSGYGYKGRILALAEGARQKGLEF